MKTSELRQIIREEISKVLNEKKQPYVFREREMVWYKNCNSCPTKKGKVIKDEGDYVTIFNEEDGIEQRIKRTKISAT